MKASEAIARIKELAEAIGGDPEVVRTQYSEWGDGEKYEKAQIESQSVVPSTDGWYVTLPEGNTEQVIKVW